MASETNNKKKKSDIRVKLFFGFIVFSILGYSIVMIYYYIKNKNKDKDEDEDKD